MLVKIMLSSSMFSLPAILISDSGLLLLLLIIVILKNLHPGLVLEWTDLPGGEV